MPIGFEHPGLLLVAAVLAVMAVAIAVLRRLAMARTGAALILLGVVALVLAAGGMTWRRASQREVVVMVDLSGSTRTAVYRDRRELDRRVKQLLGAMPFHYQFFADGNAGAIRTGGEEYLADISLGGDRTSYQPPGAGAVLLFSDARFELPPAGPRTFVVVDPGLERPVDAAVERLEIRGTTAVAQVRVTGPAREMQFSGTAATRPIRVEAGEFSIQRELAAGATEVVAQFNSADPWPENDRLSISVPPRETVERWWVGAGAPAGWRAMAPSELPPEPNTYLSPAIIVLSDVPAASLSVVQQSRLQQYVRELGGSLLILGGEHAFGAGGYLGTPLEALSPLASAPPRPVTEWFILIDGSGSMNDAVGAAQTRWDVATVSVRSLLPHLPPADMVNVGSFAEGVTWWSRGRSAEQTIATPLPPAGLGPHGPTNLRSALAEVTRTATGEGPKNLLLLTDADAELTEPLQIEEALRAAQLKLSVLAIGEGRALSALRQMSRQTGGMVVESLDPGAWGKALSDLGRAGMPDALGHAAMKVMFGSSLELPPREASPWNRVWAKATAAELATGRAEGQSVAAGARWPQGSGQVAAIAFAPTAVEAERLAQMIARPPRDPRFAVTWDAGRQVRVALDAVDHGKYLNGLAVSLELRSAGGATTLTQDVPQTGPGKYELKTDAPRTAAFATLRVGGVAVDRVALAGRYAPEFDPIGNDHAAMRELARRTGGEVIDPQRQKAIDFHWPRADVPLGTWLAVAGAVLILAGVGKRQGDKVTR